MRAEKLSRILKPIWDGYGGQTVFVISGNGSVYNDAPSEFLLVNLDAPSLAFSGASILSAVSASNGRHIAFICNVKQMYQNFASIAYNGLKLPTIFVYTEGDKVKQYMRTRSSARELPQDYLKYTPVSWQSIRVDRPQSSREIYGNVIYTGPVLPTETEFVYIPPFIPQNVNYDYMLEAAQIGYRYLRATMVIYTQTYFWAAFLPMVAAANGLGGATVIWRDEHSEILFGGPPDLALYTRGQL